MIFGDVLRSDLILLGELSAVSCNNSDFLARVEETFGKEGMIGGIVAVQKGPVPALDDEAGDIHGDGRMFCDQRFEGDDGRQNPGQLAGRSVAGRITSWQGGFELVTIGVDGGV